MSKRPRYRTLWHVSPAVNTAQIFSQGIRPDLATGARKVVWLTEWYGLMWALLHISFKKRVPVWQLACFRVRVRVDRITHFNRRVWVCPDRLSVNFCMAGEYALRVIEKQRGFVAGKQSRNSQMKAIIKTNEKRIAK